MTDHPYNTSYYFTSELSFRLLLYKLYIAPAGDTLKGAPRDRWLPILICWEKSVQDEIRGIPGHFKKGLEMKDIVLARLAKTRDKKLLLGNPIPKGSTVDYLLAHRATTTHYQVYFFVKAHLAHDILIHSRPHASWVRRFISSRERREVKS